MNQGLKTAPAVAGAEVVAQYDDAAVFSGVTDHDDAPCAVVGVQDFAAAFGHGLAFAVRSLPGIPHPWIGRKQHLGGIPEGDLSGRVAGSEVAIPLLSDEVPDTREAIAGLSAADIIGGDVVGEQVVV